MRKTTIPLETIIELRSLLSGLPNRSSERKALIIETAELYGVSTQTVYRNLQQHNLPRSTRRADYGQPRVMPKPELLRYCEVIAALKIRTSNKQGRHLSTVQAIRLLEEHGINTDNGHIIAPPGLLKKTTVNRYLKQWGYDKERLSRQPPAVRFEAEHSNQCWHFDLSSSDLKRLKNAVELEPGRGKPLLMLYSVVDDRSNKQPHRRESHSRIEDWLSNLTKDGIRQMCSWDRFCTFAREPEKRKVGIDARITVEGVAYEVEPDLAGEKVILWWGLFDHELYVEHQDRRYGPYEPIGKPIPLHSYRSFKKTNTQKRADRIEALAQQLTLPPSAIGRVELPTTVAENVIPFPVRSFVDPDPFEELRFKNAIAAKKAIAHYLVKPLAKLNNEQMAAVEAILEESLNKEEVMTKIKDYFS